MQDRRPGQCGLLDVAGDLRIQFAETGQDGQAAETQNARSQPQSNRAHLCQAPPLVLLKPSRLILVTRIDQHHSGHVTVVPDREPTCVLATSYLVMQQQRFVSTVRQRGIR